MEFIKLLLSEADERSTKGLLKFWSSDKTFNEKHQDEIQLYADTDGKQGQCPKPCGTIVDWFDCHKWFKRREDYTEFKEEEADLLIKSMITENKPKIAADLIENIHLTTKQRKLQKQMGNSTLSQDEAGAKATATDIESLRKLANDDVQKLDVTADVETTENNSKWEALAEAYRNGR